MALGTPTRNDVEIGNMGRTNCDAIQIPGDSAYTTGGSAGFEEKVQDLFGDKRQVLGVSSQLCGAGYRAVYDQANDKLVVYVAAGTEVPATTNLSAVIFNLLVFSK